MRGVNSQIVLMRPELPDAETLLPYLRQIDSTQVYTNFGPLLHRFEQRLAKALGVQDGQIVCVVNGTSGLTLALKAIDPAPGGLCAMPSWTFEATPAAVCTAGFFPWFLDVDDKTWALNPQMVEAWLPETQGRIAAVVPVSPFGAPVDIAAWDSFSKKTGIPVVIDAAAGFDSITVGRPPTVVSLHATKAFGVGEGGLVACTDQSTIARIRRLSNYGFGAGRQIIAGGFNAKMSEYVAAVGLAALDAWPAKRRLYTELAEVYVNAFKDIPGTNFAPSFSAERVQATCNIDLGAPISEQVIEELRRRGIEARRWWGKGCHRHPAFAHYPRRPLPITERLADSVVGVPFFPSLSETEILRVRDVVCATRSKYLSSRASGTKDMLHGSKGHG